jgi:DNA-binding NarL/FixJ family response regulator
MPKKRVLLVDDSAVVRSTVRPLFDSRPDFEVCGEAENGRDAIEKAESLKPDLIILDLAMPVMTGLDAAPVLRKMLPDSRLILFTAHDGPQVDQLSRAAGIHAVVPKRQAVSRLIAQAQALLT